MTFALKLVTVPLELELKATQHLGRQMSLSFRPVNSCCTKSSGRKTGKSHLYVVQKVVIYQFFCPVDSLKRLYRIHRTRTGKIHLCVLSQCVVSSYFMHVGSWTRLLSSSPHNNNTLNGEQLLLLLMLIQPTTNVDKKKIRTQTLFHVGGSLVCSQHDFGCGLSIFGIQNYPNFCLLVNSFEFF